MKHLFIVNDAPYGTEKAYNAFRLVMSLQKEHSNVEVWIFLMADTVACADARGLRELKFVDGVEISTMSQLAQWVVEADKVLIF